MCYMSVQTFIHVCVTQLEAHTVECVKVALSSHFATPTFETYIRCQFSPVLRRVQSFMTFRACLSPQKCDYVWRRRIKINIAASSDGGPKRQCKRHPGGNKQQCPAGTCTTVTLWQSGFKGYGN